VTNEIQRVALVTGSNRGLGLETSRQLGRLGYKVILTARVEAAGEAAAAELREEGMDAQYRHLDVTDHDEIGCLVESLKGAPGRIDVLVANAGIFPEGVNYPDITSALDVDMATVRLTLETNTLGHMALYQAVIPVMQSQGYGRISILSSVGGRLSDMGVGMPGYRMSHVANNALARIFAAETEGDNIKINTVCPFWVKTRMGGPEALREVEEGAETITWLATLPDDGPTGGFFRDKQQMEW
jgi:NAD(P)-dependent dehydrogenase (short-subunit alcohol dehydrogenase family)